MNNLITATEIDAWAKQNPRRAQELLPELIVRLILCTSSKINDYNFPIEKGIQFSGYDGVLDSDEATSYFPKGKSVWEFGTNEDALGKFKSDIEKRHTEPLGVDINNTAFIFSTLKIWNHKTSIEEALNESRAKYNWKEIRIIDGAKIALWLQSHTAVAVWFANIIGKPIHGVRTIEDYWTDYCETTLFEKIHSDQNIELDKLVQLEVSFLPYFRFNSTPKGIIRHLHNNPIEYVDLITFNYKPDPGSDFTVKEHSDDQGRLAYEIVELFKVVPGCGENPISEREFREWTAVAQEYADSIGYNGSFAYCFGRVLSYAPIGDDGIFPHEVVRDYFEHTHSEKLINGFISGKQSQRGVHTVTGGMEEKEISIKYREDASKLHISYPHTAAILEKLAECYWQESLYEQKRELLDFRG